MLPICRSNFTNNWATIGNVKIQGFKGFLGGRLYDRLPWNTGIACPTVIACGANCGGILHNQASGESMYVDNVSIAVEAIKSAIQSKSRLILIGSSCMYRGDHRIPIAEDEVFAGPPWCDNYAYGMAKRRMVELASDMAASHGLAWVMPVFPNLYGPGQRYGQRGHVVAGMIERIHAAKVAGQKTVKLMGKPDTRRELLYVDDAVSFIGKLVDNAWCSDVVNYGTGRTVTMKELAYAIAMATRFAGCVKFTGEHAGQPYKCMDVSKAALLGIDTPGWFRLNINLEACYEDFLKNGLTKNI